jgi:hypothetical protein
MSGDVHLHDLLLDFYPRSNDRLDLIHDIEAIALYEEGLNFFQTAASRVHT